MSAIAPPDVPVRQAQDVGGLGPPVDEFQTIRSRCPRVNVWSRNDANFPRTPVHRTAAFEPSVTSAASRAV
jgi:hypothetical protein